VRRRIAVPAFLAVAFVAAGCAIPAQNAPSPIPSSKVPFDLLNPHPPTTTTTQPKAFVPVKVFFLNSSNQLEPAARVVASPAPLSSIVTAMLAGPTSAEVANGVVTAIPAMPPIVMTTPIQMKGRAQATITARKVASSPRSCVMCAMVRKGTQ